MFYKLLFILFGLFCFQIVYSQNVKIDSSKILLQIDYGAEISIIGNQAYGEIQSIKGFLPCCSKYNPEVNVNWGLGVFSNYIFPWANNEFINSRLRSIRLFLGYDNLSTSFISQLNIYDSFDTLKPSFRVDTTQQFVQFDLNFFRLGFELEIEALKNFNIKPGFSFSLPISGKSIEKEKIIGPSIAQFQNGSKERILTPTTGDLLDLKSRFGLSLNLSYNMPFKKIVLSPFLGIDYGLNYFQPNWQVLIGRGGISLSTSYKQYGLDTIPNPPQIIDLPKIAKAEVGIYVSSKTIPVEFNKEIISRYVPVLPVVFFNQNSYEIPARYVSNSLSSNFLEEELPPNAEIINHYVLDIIGKRLTNNLSSKIILTGTTSNDENYRFNLSKERVKSVKKYLVEVWQIDEKRISIKYSLDPKFQSNSDYLEGKEENRRVEFSFSDPNLYRPIQIRVIEPSSEPSNIQFISQVVHNCGIDHWTAYFKIKNKVDSIKGNGLPKDTIVWFLKDEDRADVLNGSQIYFKMIVSNDSLKKSFESRLDSVKTKADTRFSLLQKDNKAEFMLVTFDYDRANLTLRGQEELKEIISKLGDKSKLEIIGYTDKLGDEERNVKLAESRALEITRQMPLNLPIITRGANANEAPYSVKTPEGRFLSRTVKVILTNPK